MTLPKYALWDKFKTLEFLKEKSDWSAYMDDIKSQVLEGQTLQTKPLEEDKKKQHLLFQDSSKDEEQEDKTVEVKK